MKKIGERVWFRTADGEKHRGTIDGVIPALFGEGGGASLYSIKGPASVGIVAITEEQFIEPEHND